ncbi:hypothetical protein QMK17_17205 [Rhodococcus sp. G-MC3]|uniref:hypothetical protein n=1 Tax=Rhodococcus sp. G-MC3 TaxID=3046209 RepID=UPI0024BB3713|nr:hypothetical protein [Rhodococcus sp. G-MC3]MDJ0395065.1 hypothetical protein [Rhodococcus sp. G-MC3]
MNTPRLDKNHRRLRPTNLAEMEFAAPTFAVGYETSEFTTKLRAQGIAQMESRPSDDARLIADACVTWFRDNWGARSTDELGCDYGFPDVRAPEGPILF